MEINPYQSPAAHRPTAPRSLRKWLARLLWTTTGLALALMLALPLLISDDPDERTAGRVVAGCLTLTWLSFNTDSDRRQT